LPDLHQTCQTLNPKHAHIRKTKFVRGPVSPPSPFGVLPERQKVATLAFSPCSQTIMLFQIVSDRSSKLSHHEHHQPVQKFSATTNPKKIAYTFCSTDPNLKMMILSSNILFSALARKGICLEGGEGS